MDAIYRAVCARFDGEVKAGRATIVRKRSEEALAELPDAHLDYIYLDGDHTYAGVSRTSISPLAR